MYFLFADLTNMAFPLLLRHVRKEFLLSRLLIGITPLSKNHLPISEFHSASIRVPLQKCITTQLQPFSENFTTIINLLKNLPNSFTTTKHSNSWLTAILQVPVPIAEMNAPMVISAK